MRTVEKYRQRAAEFRHLSLRGPTAELRDHYLTLADIWERMAEEWLTLEVLPGPDPHNLSTNQLFH